MSQLTDDIIRKCYRRVKRENAWAPEGVILQKTADQLGLTSERVGEALREPVPIRRYAVIRRHKNSDSGGLDNVGHL